MYGSEYIPGTNVPAGAVSPRPMRYFTVAEIEESQRRAAAHLAKVQRWAAEREAEEEEDRRAVASVTTGAELWAVMTARPYRRGGYLLGHGAVSRWTSGPAPFSTRRFSKNFRLCLTGTQTVSGDVEELIVGHRGHVVWLRQSTYSGKVLGRFGPRAELPAELLDRIAPALTQARLPDPVTG